MVARRKARGRAGRVGSSARIRHLLALDAANVMARIASRQEVVVALFSRLRDRAPLLGMVQSWFTSISFGDLARLEPREQHAVNTFHRLLEELRWYLAYTEDMPSRVQQLLTLHVRRIELAHRALVAELGPPQGNGQPLVEAEVVR
jgi:hypothetical protein